MFNKDMAVSSTITLAFHTTQHVSFTHNPATHIHYFIQDIFAFHIQASKPAREQKC